mmetsp:Transcript_33008/g.77022  ORF Transcript_33008/g.77022 Transcript_33008/m.77022 type:complete len:209 (+) Transcript_33008:149-775(+)
MFGVGSARNHADILLYCPSQQNLPGRFAMPISDLLERPLADNLRSIGVAAHGAIGCDGYTIPVAPVNSLSMDIWHPWMIFQLIGRHWGSSQISQLLHLSGPEVADTESADLSLVLKPLQCQPGLLPTLLRCATVLAICTRHVQQDQVDILKAKLVQHPWNPGHRPLPSEIIGPDFRREEDLLSWNSAFQGLSNTCTDFLVIAVYLRCI